MALDDFDDRFATAVKLALDASRGRGEDPSDDDGDGCPSADLIASYYEYALNRVEQARLETHFSECARCQGTLAALLRAAPMVDTASAAGGFAAAAARRSASESGGIRERRFNVSPTWRIAGTTAVAAAMLAVAVVAGMHVYQSRVGREGKQVVASSAAPRHHRDESPPTSSDNELARNENNSSAPAAATAAGAAPAPFAAAAGAPITDASGVSSGTPARGSSGASSSGASSAVAPPVSTGDTTAGPSRSAEPVLPSEEAAPPAGPANTEQTEEATAAGAAQAAAALGALAVTPAPAAIAAPSIATPAAAASASVAATPAVLTTPTSAGAMAGESKDTSTAAPRNSETGAPAATGAVNQKQEELAALARPTPPLQRPQKRTVTQTPAKISGTALSGNSRQSGSAAQPLAAGVASASSVTQRAHEQFEEEQFKEEQFEKDQFKKDQIEKTRLAKEKRKAELARQAELAKRDASLKQQMDRARRDARAKYAGTSSAQTSSAIASGPPQSGTSLHMPIAAAPRSAAPSGVGHEIAMADRPVASAPAVATIVRGIPVAPHALLITPTDHSIYWSLQNSGVIYRSNDRKSWTPEFTGLPADLLAGMAPSDTVCWAVGRKGAILLTRDGIHWERVNSPTASDVIGISAASKDVATIFTAGGVTYSTFDGGSNWEQAN